MSRWPVVDRDLKRALRRHPDWRLDGGTLVRELRFPDFEDALDAHEAPLAA